MFVRRPDNTVIPHFFPVKFYFDEKPGYVMPIPRAVLCSVQPSTLADYFSGKDEKAISKLPFCKHGHDEYICTKPLAICTLVMTTLKRQFQNKRMLLLANEKEILQKEFKFFGIGPMHYEFYDNIDHLNPAFGVTTKYEYEREFELSWKKSKNEANLSILTNLSNQTSPIPPKTAENKKKQTVRFSEQIISKKE